MRHICDALALATVGGQRALATDNGRTLASGFLEGRPIGFGKPGAATSRGARINEDAHPNKGSGGVMFMETRGAVECPAHIGAVSAVVTGFGAVTRATVVEAGKGLRRWRRIKARHHLA